MAEAYKTLYVRTTKVKELLQEGDTKIRIAADAKNLVMRFFDAAVEQAAKDLIDKLPRKSKGANKGQFRRITLQENDFADKPAEE